MTCCAEASISATSSPSLQGRDAEYLYETIYCARGQAENLIKQHKANLHPTAPVAARRWPTRCGSSCTPVPTGCYSTCVLQSRVGIRCGTQSSPRFAASLEDRQPYHRAREPHSYRARLMLPGGRDVQSCRAQAATVWTISQRGDDAPPSPDPFTPNASTASSTQPICRAWRAQNGRACLAKTGLQIMRPRA